MACRYTKFGAEAFFNGCDRLNEIVSVEVTINFMTCGYVMLLSGAIMSQFFVETLSLLG